MILLDSDIAIDYFRGRRAAVELVGALFDRDAIAISAVTLGEFFEGIFYGRDPVTAEQSFTRWLEQLAVLAVEDNVARRFGHIRGDLRKRGLLIADMDLLIAATALHHDLTLVTRNRRHFERVPGLKLFSQ